MERRRPDLVHYLRHRLRRRPLAGRHYDFRLRRERQPSLIARDSNIEDDQPAAGQGADTDDLSRGSVGKLDPFIGSVQMPAGIVPANSSRTYYIAVCSNAQLPTAMNATFTANPAQPLIRLEPVDSVQRIAEDHIGFSGYWTAGWRKARRAKCRRNRASSMSP